MISSRNLIDGFDLEAYLQRFSPKFTQYAEMVITCPTCGKAKLVVNLKKRAWHCWVCEEYKRNMYGRRKPVAGAGGLLDLVQLLEGCSREQAIAIVTDQAKHLSVPIEMIEDTLVVDRDVVVEAASPIALPSAWRPIEQYDALPYLRKRGIAPEDVAAFGLGYCDSGPFAGRLIFPVLEERRLVYYQARAMWDDPSSTFRKSMNPVNCLGMASSTDVLMHLDTARKFPRVALVEGPIDNVHVGASACATFGKKISMTQALKLRRAGVRAVDLMWDGPTDREPMGAWPEMMRVASLLSGMFDVRLVFIPRGDPGIYSKAENNSFRARAVSASSVSHLAMI